MSKQENMKKSLHEITQEFSDLLTAKIEVIYDLKRATQAHGDDNRVFYIEGIIIGLSMVISSVEKLEGMLAAEHYDRWGNTSEEKEECGDNNE